MLIEYVLWFDFGFDFVFWFNLIVWLHMRRRGFFVGDELVEVKDEEAEAEYSMAVIVEAFAAAGEDLRRN